MSPYLKFQITIILIIKTISFSLNEIPIETFTKPSSFLSEKIENYLNENSENIFDTNECLLSKKLSYETLKKDYNINLNKIDTNIQFILGKCNPVIFIPGIYATKLTLTINCGKLKNEEKDKFMEMRIFCGNSICKDDSIEEHPLFISLLDPATTVLYSNSNKYSSCLGFFMQFYNNKNECPNDDNGNSICYYSKNIEIGFYGSSSLSVSNSKCGLNAVQNVVQSNNFIVDSIANTGVSKVYYNMIQKYRKMGYREGFSYAGLPFDYRGFLYKNNFAINAFRYQIERLYQNTGKKVIIVAHSYGTLLTLSNLVGDNKDLSNKIKKFIAIGGPFAGSSKLLDVYMHGMLAWDININIGEKLIKVINYNPYGQHIMYKALPTIMELRPLPILNELFTNSTYKDFADAIKERLNLERFCKENIEECNDDYISEHSIKFKEVFNDAFPDLRSKDCKLINYLKFNKTKDSLFDIPCLTEMFLPSECPMILLKDKNWNPNINSLKEICGLKNNSIYYVQEECTKEQCIDNIYLQDFPYPYENKEKTQFFIDRFNKEYSKEFGKKIDNNYFEKREKFKLNYKKLIETHKKNSLTQNLPIPPVDTDVIYTTFDPTKSVFIFNRSNLLNFDDYINYGGDDTVPNWSSLLTGFKWLYDKKKNNLKQEIKLIEFCSKLGKNSEFKFDENNPKIFSAISCDCLDDNNNYKDDFKKCNHGSMIGDSFIIDYVKNVIFNQSESGGFSVEKKKAVLDYNINEDYEQRCNQDLRYLFLKEKDK